LFDKDVSFFDESIILNDREFTDLRRSGWLFLKLLDDALCMDDSLKHFVLDLFRNALNDVRVWFSLKDLRGIGEDCKFLLFDA
jgi:hypothetical protein